LLVVSLGPGSGLNDLVFQLELAGADRLVDHLPDLLVQLVLLPDAVRGPEQHRRDRHQIRRHGTSTSVSGHGSSVRGLDPGYVVCVVDAGDAQA
jgi:hypothetical protein